MNISINTIINPDINEIKVNIETPNLNDQVAELIKSINHQKDEIIAKKDGKIYLLKLSNVSEFYTLGKFVYLIWNMKLHIGYTSLRKYYLQTNLLEFHI